MTPAILAQFQPTSWNCAEWKEIEPRSGSEPVNGTEWTTTLLLVTLSSQRTSQIILHQNKRICWWTADIYKYNREVAPLGPLGQLAPA